MFFTHQLNWLDPPPPCTHLHAHLTPLYSVFHVTLGFEQRAERGQWRIACGSGWAFCQHTAKMGLFLKGPVPIHYCQHTLKSSHRMYCYSFFFLLARRGLSVWCTVFNPFLLNFPSQTLNAPGRCSAVPSIYHLRSKFIFSAESVSNFIHLLSLDDCGLKYNLKLK